MIEMTGYTLEEFNNINLSTTYVDPNERAKLLNILQESGKVYNYEIQLKKKDGTEYIAYMNIEIMEFGGEKILLSTQADITERKKIEQKLKL